MRFFPLKGFSLEGFNPLKILIFKGKEDINEQYACGWSRLHKAAGENDWRSVKSLLEEKSKSAYLHNR